MSPSIAGASRLALVLTALLAGPFVGGCDSRGPHDPPASGVEPTAEAPTPPPTPVERENSGAGVPTRPAVADPADWCDGHGVPESMCTLCHPTLVEPFQAAGDWCAEHGFPESVCPHCNPLAPPGSPPDGEQGHRDDPAHDARAGQAQPPPDAVPTRPAAADPADWCAEHGVPESMCTACHPVLADGFQAAGDWCAEHGYPESVCPFCNPVSPPEGAPAVWGLAPGTVIRFRSPALERLAGIEALPASSATLDAALETTAHIDFDRNRLAEVRSPIPGIVRAVAIDLGERVEAGDVLFELESAHVGDLQARRDGVRERVEAAEAHLARQEELRDSGIASARDLELARADLQAAEAEREAIRQALRLGGASRGGAGRFTVTSPVAGSVVRRPAVVGTFAGESEALATIADTSSMWALLDVSEWDIGAVALGQRVSVRVDGVPGRVFEGNVAWIAPEVDPRTRTVTARAELANPDGLLRAHQFATATLAVDAPEGAVAVPVDAVQRFGDGSVVFVRTGAGVYEPRRVEPGRSDGRLVHVSGAVAEGETVVTTGAFLLRTELSPDSIGAGCCEVEAPGGH